MVLAAKVPLKKAQDVKKKLLDAGMLDFSYSALKKDGFIHFPIVEQVDWCEVVDVELRENEESLSLKDSLRKVLSDEELSQLKTAYDLVGDIAIMEIDEELRHKEKLIGEKLLELQPAVKVVVRKDGGHEGELRLQDYVWLAGEQRFETVVMENGVRLKLDIRKTYYSVRSSTERSRIASLVRPGEKVLVMFSGIAPFPLVIAKHSDASEIIGVELNEDAHSFAEKNIEMNKMSNVTALLGDVRGLVPGLGLFDRICMPLPHTAQDFLDVAVPACKTGGMIHLYHFSSEEEVIAFSKTIPVRLQQLGRTGKVVHVQKCGNLGPGIHRWSLDIKID